MKRTHPRLLACLFVCLFATSSSAGTRRLDVTTSRAQTVTTPQGTHYVIEFGVPEGVVSVRQAWLEMRMDVSARDGEIVADPAPLLEVFALKRALTGEPTPSDFDTTRLPMSRPVSLGSDRLVRIEITEFAQRILADPSKNHGLVVGSMTGARSGEFTLNPDGFGPGVSVRVTIFE